MATLRVDIDSQEYGERTNFINIGYEEALSKATVYVDGSDLINHFHIECYDNWITIKRLRNEIEIVFAKNDGYDVRTGSITFHHNLDSSVYVSFIINQDVCDYSISVDTDVIEFDDLLDRMNEEQEIVKEEERIITVTTTNGSCDFIVPSIIEYAKNEDDENYFIVRYDKGLKLKKLSNSQLKIINYGKVSLYYDNYYVIKLCHRNNPKSNVQITVRYAPNNNETGFELGDGE